MEGCSPGIALLTLAEAASPAGVTDTGSVLAAAVLAAVQTAEADGAVLAGPARLACARVGARVEGAVRRAPGEALPGGWVHLPTLHAHPPLGADAGARDTEAVAGAQGVGAVRCNGLVNGPNYVQNLFFKFNAVLI